MVTANEAQDSTLKQSHQVSKIPADQVLASLITKQYLIQKGRADKYLQSEGAVLFPKDWPTADEFLALIVKRAEQNKLPPPQIQDDVIKLELDNSGALKTMELFLAFKAAYSDILLTIPESHPYYPRNAVVETDDHCCALLLATFAYRLSVEFSNANSNGLSVELRSPYPRRANRKLLEADKSIYNYYLGKQLDSIVAKKTLAYHLWSMQFSPPQKTQFAALYYPFITGQTCINCHLSSVREMQEGVIFAATLDELLESRIDGSLAIPKEPALNEILGVFVLRMEQPPGYQTILKQNED